MKKLCITAMIMANMYAFAAKPKAIYVRITTEKGEAIVRLYNETPLHRDNFKELVKKEFYTNTLFHRVIDNFMIQGGDPDSKTAQPGQLLGAGGLTYTVPAEFDTALFHKKGALAAARDNNPEKASSSTQFYLVDGRIFTDDELDNMEARMMGKKLSEEQRKVYTTVGGTPFLDQNYTVFGETVKGLEMIDAISTVVTDGNNRPITDISMKLKLLKKREVKKLEKELIQQSFREKQIMNKT